MISEGEFPSVALSQSRDRFVRVSIAVHLPRVISTFGVDPDLLISRAGLSRSLFDDPDNRIDYHKLAQLCEDASNASGCEYFGLLLGSYGSLETLGQVGAHAAHTKIVGDAIGRIIDSFREHDTGAVLDIDHAEGASGLRYLVIDPQVRSGAQITLGAITIGYRILQQFSDGHFIAKSVKLPMREPRNPTVIAEFFKCPIHFDSAIGGLFFDSRWLATSLPESEQTARGNAGAPQRSLPDSPPDKVDASAEIIAAALLRRVFAGMPAGAESLASDFNFNRRTLHRRLSRAGTSFQELRDAIVAGLAQRFLNDTDIPVSDIAILLGYSELSAFTRAFRGWRAISPSEYRDARLSTPHRQEQL